MVALSFDGDSGLPANVTGTAVTVGTFDGVHLGHQDVIAHLVSRARTLGLASLAITFDPHPLQIVNPAAAPQLLTVAGEKIEVLAESELDYLAVLKFDAELASMPAEDFVDKVLINKFKMKHLLVGHDHGFGRQRAGNPTVLRELGLTRGFEVEVVDEVSTKDGRSVSSTVIRRAIAGGDLESVIGMLGRPYSLGGTVVPGAQRGRQLGFPTLNLSDPVHEKLLPPDGVYVARVQTPSGSFGAMVNIGGKPTFGDLTRTIEAYLMDAPLDLDLYGALVRIDLLKRLRDVKKFNSPSELVDQIREDEIAARNALRVPISSLGNG